MFGSTVITRGSVEEPRDRGLAERAIRAFEEAQLRDFLDAVEQPLARAVATVIVRRERSFRAV